ncbi:2,3-bisphosphoglycerate-independent phosphoglycerate mutase [bacterium]|nr:2,3-bisphosphoglycerate-independent phosphoglycerate mutase [bacterium]
MERLDILKSITSKTETKIVLLIIDGLGGTRSKEYPQTELEKAETPNLDKLAKESVCGRIMPVSYGITPGSGPGHLAVFGYDPLRFDIGRGVLETLGLGLKILPDDVAARGNFATLQNGSLTDRRAGRIPTEKCRELCKKLQSKINEIDGIQVIIEPGMDHRFVLILRGKKLSPFLHDTDPQHLGVPPLEPSTLKPEADYTAQILKKAISLMNIVIKDEPKANTVLFRGFSSLPAIPTLQELYKLTPACIATYPLYRGVASIVGMEVLKTGETTESEFATLEEHFTNHDFFFIHIKKTDSYGEDGNYDGKVKIIEEVDSQILKLRALNPDVIIVTGDHSTPSQLKKHSWHPVPVMIYAKNCGADSVSEFSEKECTKGELGIFPSQYVMEIALANAGKLEKFGA